MQKNSARDFGQTARLYLALIHHPVVNRRGETITSAVTNLDLHDISRAARTFGVRAVYCVTPLLDQRRLVGRLIGHWTGGYGASGNPDRRDALQLLSVTASLAEAIADVAGREKQRPKTVATCARRQPHSVSCERLREHLSRGMPHLLLFGTAWGLAPEAIAEADAVLAPVEGAGRYNHLSVRSAAAIILDRLAGRRSDDNP